jgi:hypothetical protein
VETKTMPEPKRSLYQCFNARVKGDRIYCSKGYSIGTAKDGAMPVVKLARGAPLELGVCQECVDYDEIGPPVPKEERGWLKELSKEANYETGRNSG